MDRLLDALFPPLCVGCGAEETVLCEACRRLLAARADADPGVPIGLPSDVPRPLVQLESCAPYGPLARRAIHALKYGGERRLARPLGELVARRWERAGRGGDVLVPVPVHASRARERGYDQAALIARHAAAALGLPFLPALVRTRATIAQYELDRPARAGNVAGAFAVAAGRGDSLGGRWLVLVDDVVTTGATLVSCAEALIGAGAGAVSAVTVARER
jgi:ComF family protein